MLHTTRGVVLSYIKYGETSVIARIFTEVLGLQAYIVRGVRTKKPRYSVALFQPLTLLDMVAYHKKQRSVHRIAEVQRHTPNSDILMNRKKGAIAIFLAEILTKVIREEEGNKKLFDFLWRSVVQLNDQTTHYEYFYLIFMLRLSHYLGFGISHVQDLRTQLLRLGISWEIDQETLMALENLLQSSPLLHTQARIDKAVTRRATEAIIKFYQLHIEPMDIPKSLSILQEIS